MRQLIRKTFGIFPGEEKHVFTFIKLATVWAIGSCIAETLAISLFTEKVGSAFLPKSYLFTALTLISVSCLYMYLLKFVSPYKIMIVTMMLASVAYTIIAFSLLGSPPRCFWFLFQISCYTFGSALVACFWMFIAQYHDLQDAKRLFGVYNAAYFLGYIISGCLIKFTYEKLGPSTLFIIAILTMVYSIYESKKIFKTIPVSEDDVTEDYFAGGKKTFAMIFMEFYKSPFAIFLISMSLSLQLLRTCTEYGYLEALEKHFSSGSQVILKNTIPEFLGTCKAIISSFNIIIGIFFYRKLLNRIGLSNLILIPPLYFVSLYAKWSIYETLFVAILGIVAIECVQYTLEDNNFNLLINAAPVKLRGILRLINDSFFEPIGMLLSSFFLLILTNGYKILGLTLALIFFGLAIITKYLYPKSLIKSLKQNSLHFERKTKMWFKNLTKKEQKETKKILLNSLESEQEDIRLLSLKTLLEFNDKNILEKILLFLSNASTSIKLKALDIMEKSPFSNDAKIIDLIINIKENAMDELLIKKAHFYLAKKGLISIAKIKKDLDAEDLILRASAILSMKLSKGNIHQNNIALNRTIAQRELQLLFNYNKTEEICMGLDILSLEDTDEATETAMKYLSNKNLIIKRKAAQTLSKIADKTDSKYISKILYEMSDCPDNAFILFCLETFGRINDSTTVKDLLKLSINFKPIAKRLVEKIIINMGLKTVPVLISILKDTTINERARISAGKILKKLSSAQLKNNLLDIITPEIKKAYFYFYWANSIQEKYPLYNLSLLKNALQKGFQSKIDFIIHILSQASLIEDCDLIVKALHVKTTKAHANAIETLEQKVERSLFVKIKPLIDDIPLDYQLQESQEYIDTNLSLNQLLDRLENSHLFFDKIIAAHLKVKLQMPNWQQSLREQIKKSDESFHQLAYELLEQ